jgi:hypothetical protein
MTLNIVSIDSIQVGQCIYIAIDKDPIKVTYVDIGRVEGIGCNSMGYVFIKRRSGRRKGSAEARGR